MFGEREEGGGRREEGEREEGERERRRRGEREVVGGEREEGEIERGERREDWGERGGREIERGGGGGGIVAHMTLVPSKSGSYCCLPACQ